MRDFVVDGSVGFDDWTDRQVFCLSVLAFVLLGFDQEPLSGQEAAYIPKGSF